MKRISTGIALTLLLCAMPSPAQEKKLTAFASDLLPLKVGNSWTYLGNDGKERVSVHVEKQVGVKRRVKAGIGDKEVLIEGFVLRTKNGDKSLQESLFIADDGIYRFTSAGKEISPPIRILKLPPAKGDTWSCDSLTETTTLKGDFVVDQAMVTLPGRGETLAWVSSTKDFYLGEEKLEASYYFVPGVGIAKQHVKIGRFDLKLSLIESKIAPGGAIDIPQLPLVPAPKAP